MKVGDGKKKKHETPKHCKNDNLRQHIARANLIRRTLLGLIGTIDSHHDFTEEKDLNTELERWGKNFPRYARERIRNIMEIEPKNIVTIDACDGRR